MKMPDYSKMTNQEFDSILIEILEGKTAAFLLTIPGIYEILSEHFNNNVLRIWSNRKAEAK